MEENIKIKTGKSVTEWISVIKKKDFQKHGEIVKFLKSEYAFTHGYANFVALKARESDAASFSEEDLISVQYKNKGNLIPIYEAILAEVKRFGGDVEIAPKKANVSLRRKNQFALVQPTTKTRIDLGLKIKGKEPAGRLENSGPFGAMCTHRVKLEKVEDFDAEVKAWLREAYEGGN